MMKKVERTRLTRRVLHPTQLLHGSRRRQSEGAVNLPPPPRQTVENRGNEYSIFITWVLEEERAREQRLDDRGQRLVTTGLPVVGLLIAVAGYLGAGDGVNTPAAALVCLAAVALLLAALLGAWSLALRPHEVADISTLEAMVESSDKWRHDSAESRRNASRLRIKTIRSVREANNERASWITVGFWTYFAGIVLAVVGLIALIWQTW